MSDDPDASRADLKRACGTYGDLYRTQHHHLTQAVASGAMSRHEAGTESRKLTAIKLWLEHQVRGQPVVRPEGYAFAPADLAACLEAAILRMADAAADLEHLQTLLTHLPSDTPETLEPTPSEAPANAD